MGAFFFAALTALLPLVFVIVLFRFIARRHQRLEAENRNTMAKRGQSIDDDDFDAGDDD